MDGYTKRTEKVIAAFVIVILIVIAGWFLSSKWQKRGIPKVDPSVYQVVLFDSNQQYFGHLKNLDTKYPYLTDIYYMKVQEAHPENPDLTKFSLVKLGSEIHGPEDVMYFNRDRIIFWENLRTDSKVVQGILQEKAQKANLQSSKVP